MLSLLGVVIIAFAADVLDFSDLTCVRRVSGWTGGGQHGRWLAQEVVGMGGGWHRKCEWAAEELQVMVAQEMWWVWEVRVHRRCEL